MEYKISEELLNKILQYLSTKPYIEVAELIALIQKNVEPIKEDKKHERKKV